MDYTLLDNGRCAGVVGTQPEHDNWTLTPYLGGLVKEQWNGKDWIEGATEIEIEEIKIAEQLDIQSRIEQLEAQLEEIKSLL